jgi:hypothetical protein
MNSGLRTRTPRTMAGEPARISSGNVIDILNPNFAALF